ncbi:SH3 domain-containing protein [Sphingobacterium sp. LRF_L2]|uniref:SH3 domain-containing protein n=1 Tax=Sphingobacterium sp. LRF_L2 TaxID=3369421 RepID=UPI003F5D937B
MKKLNYFVYLASLFVFFSCNNNAQTRTHVVQDSLADTVTPMDDNMGNPIDYDQTEVIGTVYVIDRNGTAMKQQANKEAKSLGVYAFGTRLDVIEETEQWLGVRDRVTRKFSKDGKEIESNGWEKVYVLKSQTGAIDEITLIPSDLNIVSLLSANQKTETYENGKQLTEHVQLELINKALFDSKKSTAVNFLLADTAAHRKTNGVIELVCDKKTVTYVDKPDAEADIQEFQYVGQIAFLNHYLIMGSYWESADYRFVDKTSGEETNIFVDYPYVSPDRKYVLCIYANPYEITADLELYTVADNKLNKVMDASFKNWMPNEQQAAMFWGADGYFYLAANHANAFWGADGKLNDKCQYMRIKIV